MNKKTLVIIIVAFLFGVGFWSLLSNEDVSLTPSSSMAPAHDMHTPAHDSGHVMEMMVESERDFIEEMIPHHEEAVLTAQEVLLRGGTTPAMRALAEGIIEAQSAEIVAMKQWYEAWYHTPYVARIAHTMMRDLSALEGAALDRVFLEDMIIHHKGAIMMARSVTPYIEHAEIAELTDAIMTTQTAEIGIMEELLRTLESE